MFVMTYPQREGLARTVVGAPESPDPMKSSLRYGDSSTEAPVVPAIRLQHTEMASAGARSVMNFVWNSMVPSFSIFL